MTSHTLTINQARSLLGIGQVCIFATDSSLVVNNGTVTAVRSQAAPTADGYYPVDAKDLRFVLAGAIGPEDKIVVSPEGLARIDSGCGSVRSVDSHSLAVGIPRPTRPTLEDMMKWPTDDGELPAYVDPQVFVTIIPILAECHMVTMTTDDENSGVYGSTFITPEHHGDPSDDNPKWHFRAWNYA